MELARKFPFSVDTWTPASARKKYHFLTHAHKDHTAGIAIHGCYPIYCTSVTKQLLIKRYLHTRLDEFMFVDLEVGESVLIDDIDGSFTVTAFDANHCPGAVMLLFEGHFGNVLHTGDCRLSSDCLAKLPRKYICKDNRACGDGLDFMYLDCTFGRESFKMPSKYAAIRQVLSCIWRHPSSYPVYLACDVLGHEEILMEISKTFGSRIYVDKSNLAEYHAVVCIVAPDLLTEDPLCRFHVCEGFPRLYERAKAKFDEAQRNVQLEPLIIRPSTQWYICEEQMGGADSGLITSAAIHRKTQQPPKEAQRDQFGVWHVCFSMHSSKEELEEALAVLSPKEVISNMANCRATELCYVREKMCNARSCFQLDPDRRFKTSRQTLFEVGLMEGIGQVSAIQSTMINVTEKKGSHMKQKGQSLDFCAVSKGQNIDRHWQLPSPTKPLPLFGKARYSLPPSPPMSFSDGEDTCGSPKCRASLCDAAPLSPPLHSLQEMEAIPCEKNLSQSASCTEGEKLWTEGRISPDSRKGHEKGMQLCVHMEDSDEEFKSLPKLRDQSDQAEITGSPSSGKDGETQNRLIGCVTKENRPGFGGRNPRPLHESLRKMYRSLHVPIPQPLPSLLELANLIERPKLRASQSCNEKNISPRLSAAILSCFIDICQQECSKLS